MTSRIRRFTALLLVTLAASTLAFGAPFSERPKIAKNVLELIGKQLTTVMERMRRRPLSWKGCLADHCHDHCVAEVIAKLK